MVFGDYKAILKNLRDLQDQLWGESAVSFPAAWFPTDLNDWQRATLENVNSLVESSVRQALQLQRDWLRQWTERAGATKLKHDVFSDLSAEAIETTQRWLDNQAQLWDQWLELLRASGGPGGTAGFEDWQEAVQKSLQGQMALLNDWANLADVEKLSAKELSKLSRRIDTAMQKSIETQQRLWSLWFDDLGIPGQPAQPQPPASDRKTKRKSAKVKEGGKARKASGKSSGPEDDLKQVSGIGPSLEKKLKQAGIRNLRQIAALSEEDIADLETRIVQLRGRIKRDDWPAQARKLIS